MTTPDAANLPPADDPLADALTRELAAMLGDEGLLTDDRSRALYSSDLLTLGESCVMVVRPSSLTELQRALKAISTSGHALTPRGGGYSYVRGYTPQDSATITIDLGRMNRIVSINETDMYIEVEAGVTWRQIYEALKPRGLRLPFFGTFSGRGATVGGGLSNGALFFGSARYGTVADIVLGMEIVLASGELFHTGQRAAERAGKPFFRGFGPDMNGLFVHDAGAMGIKAKASLRMIRAPQCTDFLSFGFSTQESAAQALSEISRSEVAEEAFVMDPARTQVALRGSTHMTRDLRALCRVVCQEKRLFPGLRAGAKMVLAGRDFGAQHCWSLHMTLAGRSRAGVDHDKDVARTILYRLGGYELPDTIPRVSRADIFSTLDNVVGHDGQRFVAINAKIAHSDAAALLADCDREIALRKDALRAHDIEISRLFSIISNNGFSYEIVMTWPDAWLPLHRETASRPLREKFAAAAANPEARSCVMDLRESLIAIFARHGAASGQLGRSYPYREILRERPGRLLDAVKHHLDPERRMNPGALQL